MEGMKWFIIGILAFFVIYWMVRYEIQKRYVKELERNIKKIGSGQKEKAKLIMIGDYLESYRKGENVYTVIRKISDIIREG